MLHAFLSIRGIEICGDYNMNPGEMFFHFIFLLGGYFSLLMYVSRQVVCSRFLNDDRPSTEYE